MRFNRLLSKLTCITLITVILYSCHNSVPPAQQRADTIAINVKPQQDTLLTTLAPDTDTTDFADVFVTVADTGQNYYDLRKLMFALNTKLKWPIDTMDRYYNERKNEIVVADTDEDEMYRGEYFPRRLPSESLSLEYYRVYSDTTTDKNIALVTGIYEQRHRADSAFGILRHYAPHSFLMRARVYVGCMH